MLDLMAGPDSHLGSVGDPAMVVGARLNQKELEANPVFVRSRNPRPKQ